MGTVVFIDEKYNDVSSTISYYTDCWFDLDQYHKYEMGYISKEERFQRGPQAKQFNEVRLWIQDNLEGEVIVKRHDQTSSGFGVSFYLYFQHESDMIAFKLRWS